MGRVERDESGREDDEGPRHASVQQLLLCNFVSLLLQCRPLPAALLLLLLCKYSAELARGFFAAFSGFFFSFCSSLLLLLLTPEEEEEEQ